MSKNMVLHELLFYINAVLNSWNVKYSFIYNNPLQIILTEIWVMIIPSYNNNVQVFHPYGYSNNNTKYKTKGNIIKWWREKYYFSFCLQMYLKDEIKC